MEIKWATVGVFGEPRPERLIELHKQGWIPVDKDHSHTGLIKVMRPIGYKEHG